MQRDTSSYYLSLPEDKSETVENAIDNLELKHNECNANSSYPWVIRLALLVIVTCTLVDVFTLVYMWTRLENSPSQIDLESIPYRSTYMKLDELYLKKKQKSSSYPPIHNLPRVLSQVSSLERNKVFPIWTDLRMIDTGYAPIGERRLLVNQDISTVTQFHVLDYGMENCSIVISVPEFTIDPGNFTKIVHNEGVVELDAWILDTHQKLDFTKLSWNSKPRRRAHLGIFSLQYGTTQQSPGFKCQSGSFQTIEISCHSENCSIDTNAKWKEKSGLFMKQYQTI